jgi:hypothetical protein
MELKEAVERLLETRDRHAKNIKMLEESKVYVKNTAFEEVLIERRKDVETIDTVLAELDTITMNYTLLEEKFDGSAEEKVDKLTEELDKQKQVKAEMRKVAWEEGYNQGYLAGAMESI